MPLIRNKYQPYFPDPDSPNIIDCGGKNYCHPIASGDTVMSQFYQTPCNDNEVCDPEFDDYTLGSELLLNPSFIAASLPDWSSGGLPLSATLGVVVNGWTGINPGKVEHISGSTDSLSQSGLGLVVGETYQITINLTVSTGYIEIVLGDGVDEVVSDQISFSGSYSFNLVHKDSGDDIFQIRPSSDYVGNISDVSLKQVTFDCWDTQGSWTLSNGFACHIDGNIDDLKNSSANYIDAGGYYLTSVTITGYQSGSIQVYVSDILAGTILANGTYNYYSTPTLNGTLKFTPSSDFIGCISNPNVYKLKNDYVVELVDSNGTIYDISDSVSYYEQYVTLAFNFETYELANDCYTLNVYDQCVIESNNLVYNGDFVDGFTDWIKNNGPSQYAIVGNQLKFIFSPFTQGFTQYVTNTDFSGGTTGWTFGAGWSLVGGKARHTAGNVATLTQTLTLPTPPPPATGYTYYVKFVVSNWTTGTIKCQLGTVNAGSSNGKTWAGNDTFIQTYSPQAGGLVDIIFTPSSTFDGDVDDIEVIGTNAHSAYPFISNTTNPNITPGTYQVEWELVSTTDSRLSARAYLNNALPSPSYQTSPALYSFTQTYTLNGGKAVIIPQFAAGSLLHSNLNLIAGEIVVDNISIKKIEPFEATYSSECINYNSNGFPKTKMIIGICDQTSFGYEFVNTGFKIMQRAVIRSFNPEYRTGSEYINSGTGNGRLVYSEIEKFWRLDTDFASETFHDTMNLIINCDHFGIGDTDGNYKEYITSGEQYSVSWDGNGATNLAVGSVNVRIKEKGQIFNRHI